jgi:predicted ribosomally synthesized peptide with SipW-like signal peptide
VGETVRRKALLIVGLALLIAAAGVAYAHWTDTLNVNASVQTGNIGFQITRANTDDDGALGYQSWDHETGVPGAPYDAWPATNPEGSRSSADPSSWLAETRYDKDVAGCWVRYPLGTNTVNVEVIDAYPSYHCTIRVWYNVLGTVPVRAQRQLVSVCFTNCADPANWAPVAYNTGTGTFIYESGDGDPYFELDMTVGPGMRCGDQYHQGKSDYWTVGFHVMQGAEQSATYQVRMTQEFVNCNEWSEAVCYGFRGVNPTGTGT